VHAIRPSQERNSKFYIKDIGIAATARATPIAVGGRIDGLGRRDELVEFKNRVEELPAQIPPYDIAQFHVYLYLLGRPAGKLVERLKSTQEELRVTDIAFDRGLWGDTMLPRMRLFGSALDSFMAADSGTRERYLRGSEEEQKELIRNMWAEAHANA
jgi:hypothetical protein